MKKTFDEYINQIPEDFELLLKGLGNTFRISLVLLIMEKKSLSLSKIIKLTNKENSSVINHIKKLQLAGIFQNFLKKEQDTREFSFYEVTQYGKKVVSDLITSYNNSFKNIKVDFYGINLKFTEKLPEDFELMLKALSNKFRFALTLYLIEHGQLSFNKITKITKKEKSLIANHIKKLELGGLIQNFLEKKKETKDYSYYRITLYGKTIVSNLLNSYNEYYSNIEQEIPQFSKEIEETSKSHTSPTNPLRSKPKS